MSNEENEQVGWSSEIKRKYLAGTGVIETGISFEGGGDIFVNKLQIAADNLQARQNERRTIHIQISCLELTLLS